MTWRVWPIIAILVLAARLSIAEEDRQRFEKASSLEKSGKLDEAFLAYLTIPGAQHIAARIARPEAEHFLKLVRAHAAKLPHVSPSTVPSHPHATNGSGGGLPFQQG